MSHIRYHIRKCFPLVTMYVLGIFCMIWVLQSKLEAGDTLFKDCNSCGCLNYQFSNTCSTCGATNNFTDTYFKPDMDKLEAKKKKQAKMISKELLSEIGAYERFVKPIDNHLHIVAKQRQFVKENLSDEIPELYIEKLDSAFDNLLRAKNDLVDFFYIQDHFYHHRNYHNE